MPPDPTNGFSIRPFTLDDLDQVQRLAREGLLPDQVDYEAEQAERIGQSFGSDRERFFVAVTPDGRVIGTVAVIEGSPDTAHVHWLRVDPSWPDDVAVRRALIAAAAAHAREVGLLKLAMHAPASLEERVAAYYHRLGFELSRTRELHGVHGLEFYLNLYERPELGGRA
jgi:ribosomal protein S18 acetylase RimI-like enzyme